MALTSIAAKRELTLMHHSDRGQQYCCGDYTGQLTDHGIYISMTEKGDPYENAIAERVNEILKTEFELDKDFASYDVAKRAVEKAIDVYNNLRPHASCNYQTPSETHKQEGRLIKRWKKTKRTEAINI